jgi:hypothetical protein
MHEQYVALRRAPYAPPENAPLYVGTVPDPALAHLERSVQQAINRAGNRRTP